jgi:hypothetical protein
MTAIIDGTNGITSPGIVGVTDGSNALAGTVGEYVSSYVSNAGTVASGTAVNATSITLTAGDWDVQGTLLFNYQTGNIPTAAYGGITSSSATLPTLTSLNRTDIEITLNTGSGIVIPVPSQRVNITSTTTYYLVVQTAFTTGSNPQYGGSIRARRMR